ncbi:hypothetical protein GJ629_06745 [Halapricum sp. CBA1109]|uniref:hypothetical protein n=1 Tax=Halapricum sp. CBA1109 TaxID=2668068 RepID=UPI0012F83DA8|nr:hypothetical protein [Halapricum sp. CBA1109]MUV89627.1 hypothetical protein [Halapricum sp. CBA1109]
MTRHSTLTRPRDRGLVAAGWSPGRSSEVRSLGTLGAGVGRFNGTLPVGIAFGPRETPALSLVAGLGANRPSPDGTAPGLQSTVSRSRSTTLVSVDSGPRSGVADRSTTPGQRTDPGPTARLGPQTTVARAESEPSEDRGGTHTVDSSDADRPRTASLPPLTSTATETDGEESDSSSSLRSLSRFAAAVFRLARTAPAAGLSASSVRLAVRSFALRHGRPASAASDRVRSSAWTRTGQTAAGLGTLPVGPATNSGAPTDRPPGVERATADAPTLRYEDAATDARSGGNGRDTDDERLSEATLDQPSTGDRSSTGSAVDRQDAGATDRERTSPETPPVDRRQSSGGPDAREGGDPSRETGDGVTVSATETDGDVRTTTDEGDAPGDGSLPTLADIDAEVSEDGSVEGPALSAGTDRVLRRLYRDFERRSGPSADGGGCRCATRPRR